MRLRSSNARIAAGLFFGPDGVTSAPPMIALEKIDSDKRGKLPHLAASFCPFCGKRYENDRL